MILGTFCCQIDYSWSLLFFHIGTNNFVKNDTNFDLKILWRNLKNLGLRQCFHRPGLEKERKILQVTERGYGNDVNTFLGSLSVLPGWWTSDILQDLGQGFCWNIASLIGRPQLNPEADWSSNPKKKKFRSIFVFFRLCKRVTVIESNRASLVYR